MSVKDEFLAAIDEDFPSSLKDKLNITIPSVPGISFPTEVEPSIIAQGQLAANLNLILQQLEGLPIVEMMMHLGQKNKAIQNMLLTCLEFLDRGQMEIQILSPLSGQVFAPSPVAFMCVVKIVRGFLDFESAVAEVGGKNYPLIGTGRIVMAEMTLPSAADIPNKDTWSIPYAINVTGFFKTGQAVKGVTCTFKNA